jgi:hypothetical protein
MAISKKTWTGNAKETTPGTAITTPVRYIPTKTVFKGGKKRVYLNEERGDRNANYGVVDSVRQSSISMKGPWYNDVHPTILWAGLGLPTTSQPDATNVPTVYKHTIQLQDIPPSYTTHRSFDFQGYYVPYSVLEKWDLDFTADGKLLECDASYLGLFAQPFTPGAPTYSTLLPFAGYAPTIKLVDGAVSNDIEEMKFEYAQKIGLWYPANGSPDFVTVYFGERTMKVSFTARFDSTTIYNRWRNNTNDSLTFDVQGQALGKTFLVTLGSPSAGTFTLTYNGQTTAGITFNATAATVQSTLTGLSTVGSSNATVTGSAGGPYTVSFLNALAGDGFLLTGSGTGLTGGTFSVSTGTFYNQELNLVLPTISYDDVEHDTGKENVLIKAKATAIVPAGSALLSGFVQNTISSYTT